MVDSTVVVLLSELESPMGPKPMQYWCKTPEGQAYCCETVHNQRQPVGTKPLDCPQVRPTCPRFMAPNTCSNDYKCAGLDKCCFDRCLREHTLQVLYIGLV
ncbi:uncharacterized protein LOC119568319 [Penaeus monodon]|uniref:uncharacterized protein LOC119568319 n=1 Tax=Penaeus monodon TaxID=6687 RepID=UPI0018A782AD|nr:uncharacterized protein LOC119568319 [Penaeus monodon]